MLVIGPASFDALRAAAQDRAAIAGADRLSALGFAHLGRPKLVEAWKRSDDVADKLGWTEPAWTDRLARLQLVDSGRPADLVMAAAYSALRHATPDPDHALSVLERQLSPATPSA